MASYRENYEKVKLQYETKKLNAIKDAEARTAAVHGQYPDIAEIDKQLRATGLSIMQEATKGLSGLDERLKRLEEQNAALQNERRELLKKYGLPADCTDPKYECAKCTDTGYVGIKMCHCFKAAMTKLAFEGSGLGALLKDQSFDTFDLSYYTDNKANYEKIRQNVDTCKAYAEGFNETSDNLLLMGPTGLGKTHLSTSIAKRVLEKGYGVVYDSATNVFNDFNKEQFKGENGLTEKYFDCDLLILDDLGTEMHTPFTVSCFYNLINTRLNAGKSTIINTNLTIDELRKVYSDRITSRMFGCFRPLMFAGKDIRMQKLQRGIQ